MNIQPTASTGAAKTDERVVAAASTGTAKPTAATDSAGKVKAAADGVEPTRSELDKAVKTLNDSMTTSSQDLQFSVDEDSKKTVVKLVDRTTHEVLRQMPSKEALEIARSIDKAMGKLIDQQA
jgi:flagellar protein FlaG